MSTDTPRVRGTTYNLLFVCTGNTCRSPMAAAIATGMLEARGWTHVAVQSAGTGAARGATASPHAVDVAREHDLDLSGHASQALTPDLVQWADLILAMGPSHIHAVADLGGHDKVSLVTQFLEGDAAGSPVADPFGGDHNSYREAFAQLSDAIAAVLDRLEPILAP
jgi:protein-tyrosine-phosphatase